MLMLGWPRRTRVRERGATGHNPLTQVDPSFFAERSHGRLFVVIVLRYLGQREIWGASMIMPLRS
jgi:hypothetical protein